MSVKCNYLFGKNVDVFFLSCLKLIFVILMFFSPAIVNENQLLLFPNNWLSSFAAHRKS